MNLMLKRLGIPIVGGAMAIGVATVGPFEGKRNDAYRDPVGIPTICYGYTHDVEMGQTKSDAECRDLLKNELGNALAVVDASVDRDMPDTRRAALASFVYNVGSGAYQDSTLLRKLKAGEVREACNELSRWVYAGGKRLAGLAQRRATERALCLVGMQEGGQ
ncbi:lysozyme [Chromohalobacter moromii]|uniref:Lysozyme n=1 Tax=Chromohalobacter moromii TaxID=2860329 RepID=A0A9X2X4G1_9GAMM|nr:lysozyme [Chromohalobacter moromii]MCT8506154.1 lysozyme [Chromohalobacter moromii]